MSDPTLGTDAASEIAEGIHDRQADIHPTIQSRYDANLSALVEAIAETLGDFNDNAEAVFDDTTIEAASPEALQLLGDAVGVEKQASDTTEQYRTRIRVNYHILTSAGTYTDVAGLAERIFDGGATSITINGPPGDDPLIVIQLDKDALDETDFTTAEISDFFDAITPAGHPVEIQTFGSFRLDGSGYTPPSGSGLGSGNGTLGAVVR